MNFETYLLESNLTISSALYVKYKTMFESPHAEVRDAHNNELLLDMFQEKDGEVRPDNRVHDWIEYLGDLLRGEAVVDFYNQEFDLDYKDISIIEDEIVNNYHIFVMLIRQELDKNPHKAQYLPKTFLEKIYNK